MLYLLESFLVCLLNLVACHMIIHSILVGNMPFKNYKSAKLHARTITSSQSVGSRITQMYVKRYITKFTGWYKAYMLLKLVSVLLWLTLCVMMCFLNTNSRIDNDDLAFKGIIALEIVLLLFLCSRFGWLDRRTSFEKDCGNGSK